MSISFDRAVDYYDQTRGYPPEVADRIGAALAELAGATARTRFLEVGVGTGRIALPLIARGFDYTGIDISRAMMDRLQEKVDDLARRGQVPRVRFLEADMQALPFADADFDVVLAVHVFHLVADPPGAVREALRVLRPEGVLLICADASRGDEPETIGERWRAIVRQRYGHIPTASERASEVLSGLLGDDAAFSVDEQRPVHWEFTTTPAREIETISRRMWSNTWALPDDVFAACLAQLTAWCRERYGDEMERPLARRAEFIVRRVRRLARSGGDRRGDSLLV